MEDVMAGIDFLVKFANPEGDGFDTIAGIRSKRISLNGQFVNLADGKIAQQWQEIIGRNGLQSASISGSGIFKDAASDERGRAAFFSGRVIPMRHVFPFFGTIDGGFQITALEYAGGHAGEINFDMALTSAGDLEFDPEGSA
jgi:TP901-1 family phage major tail protein